jgi:NTP pyrophosphatase (non-canonical NTP hydrolase)
VSDSHLPDHIRALNRERVVRWHPPETDDWTLGDWGNAFGGECGELQNVVKKIRRRQSKAATDYNTPKMNALRAKYAEERADVLIYLDLLDRMVDAAIGISDADLAVGIVNKFNLVSRAQGWYDLEITQCFCGKIPNMMGSTGIEIGGTYHRMDGPCFHGSAQEIADFINEGSVS